MGWTTNQQKRLSHELVILRRFFPSMTWQNPTVPGATYVEGPLWSNSGARYQLRVYVPAQFPAICPDMIVAWPAPLRDHRGKAMTKASNSMHTLGTRDGGTMICHYNPARWVPENTLYKVLLKGRIWLEAYEGHLRSGNQIEYFLKHMPAG
jgi:hypothetical protein